ncbi:MAG: efflux RND transporter permease subunit, partial [Gammaproteobacteria bacterium]|nr:efflux RND transporter permease subunit [Gammaproteobacteria bacterium]
SPVMSSQLVRERSERPRLAAFVEARFTRLRERYARVLDATLAQRNTTLVAGGAALLLLAPLFLLSPRELAPTEDQGEISIFVESAPDASVRYTAERTADVVRRLLELPEAYLSWEVSRRNVGFGGMALKDYSQRERSAMEILPQAYGLVRDITGARAFVSLAAALPGAGQFDVEMVVTAADDIERMLPVAQSLVKAARASGRFMFADTDLKVDISQASVVIDRNRVADLGLDLTQVGQELGVLLGGAYVNRFNLDGRSYKVIPQMGEAERRDVSRLLDLKVMGPGGQLIPVSSFARVESNAAPRSLNRFQQRNSFRINGGIFPGLTKEQGLAALEAAAAEVLPPGYAIDYAGESRQIRTEGATLSGTLAFAVVLIYLVLTAQFGNFRDPLVILLASVPLALTSALVFTFLEFTTINIFTQVGLITLVGLIAKNGILIVEFANKLREAGQERMAAIREASLERLRPVLMTTAATVFGHLPLVLVSGPGAAARNSIGIVLVSGMAIGTLFTLLILPAVYLWLSGAHEAGRAAAGSAAGRDGAPGRTAASASS